MIYEGHKVNSNSLKRDTQKNTIPKQIHSKQKKKKLLDF